MCLSALLLHQFSSCHALLVHVEVCPVGISVGFRYNLCTSLFIWKRHNFKHYQDGELHDLFCLFCTCIRTERVNNLFISSLFITQFIFVR